MPCTVTALSRSVPRQPSPWFDEHGAALLAAARLEVDDRARAMAATDDEGPGLFVWYGDDLASGVGWTALEAAADALDEALEHWASEGAVGNVDLDDGADPFTFLGARRIVVLHGAPEVLAAIVGQIGDTRTAARARELLASADSLSDALSDKLERPIVEADGAPTTDALLSGGAA